MLNPKLHLSSNVFDLDAKQKATRDGFGNALVELGSTNKDVVVLTADLSESTRTEEFEKKFKERFFEVGVAEQNMAAIAAGFAISGKIPFISSYAVFSPGKNWETIRTTIIYKEANVKIAGHHAGIITGADGSTHQATEDIAITRVFPGITIFVPCDAIEAKKATIEAANIKGPVYLRFSREKTPIITTEKTPFDKNTPQTFWISENPKVTVFAAGYSLYYALLAAKILEQKQVNVIVVNLSTIKPANEKEIVELAKKTNRVVSVEDHQIMGGLGSMIAEVLAKNSPIPMGFVGLQDTFAESGSSKDLIKKYKIDELGIMEAVEKVIAR